MYLSYFNDSLYHHSTLAWELWWWWIQKSECIKSQDFFFSCCYALGCTDETPWESITLKAPELACENVDNDQVPGRCYSCWQQGTDGEVMMSQVYFWLQHFSSRGPYTSGPTISAQVLLRQPAPTPETMLSPFSLRTSNPPAVPSDLIWRGKCMWPCDQYRSHCDDKGEFM